MLELLLLLLEMEEKEEEEKKKAVVLVLEGLDGKGAPETAWHPFSASLWRKEGGEKKLPFRKRFKG
jgi:hypothetical protein